MDTNNGKKRLKKSEETRQRLFEAGLDLMKEKGFQAATIRTICSRAGVSIGTFYLYYNTKSDILREIYIQGDEFMLNADLSKAGDTPLDKIAFYIDRYAELTVNTGLDSMKVLYNPDNEWFVQFRGMQQKLDDLIKEGQSNGQITKSSTPEELTDFLFVCMRGVCYHWCNANGNYDLRERMHKYMSRVLLSLKPEKCL